MDSQLHIQYVPSTYKVNKLEIFSDLFFKFIKNNSLYSILIRVVKGHFLQRVRLLICFFAQNKEQI